MNELSQLLDTLVVFRRVRDDKVLSALYDVVTKKHRQVRRYSDFVAALFAHDYNFSRYLLNAVSEDENEYVRLRARGEAVPPALQRCVEGELAVFQRLSRLTSEDLRRFVDYDGYLPAFETTELDFAAEYEKRLRSIHRTGYGVYARHTMFRVEGGRIVPVRSPDQVSIAALYGYEAQRQKIIDNTEALLAGLPAANALLVGDAGTGKSTTVKAVANLLADRGVRLIEMKKEQLHDIPRVMEQLRENPLKFILFIDDLSFNKNDDNFSALKATLEGSASAKAPNVVIYATSNRRHLVKETFTDRDGDDVHRNDTMQELLSLSERFGLSILFTRPSKDLYLSIVHGLCGRKGIPVTETLDVEAAAFALRKGGMSPRAAEQFTDSILAREKPFTDQNS